MIKQLKRAILDTPTEDYMKFDGDDTGWTCQIENEGVLITFYFNEGHTSTNEINFIDECGRAKESTSIDYDGHFDVKIDELVFYDDEDFVLSEVTPEVIEIFKQFFINNFNRCESLNIES